MANKDKAKGAEYSRRAREKKKAEDARLGVEQVVIEMPAGIKWLLAAEVKRHGYDQVQALWQDLALSWAAADPEERARRLQRPDAPAFEISPKLARQFELASEAELKRDPGCEIIPPIQCRSRNVAR
ncbi:hypothetical protein V0R50_10385 [Pseudomonas sp. 148P]|uniref:Uncharacterized protein n=1 Tax=Pseudomonas ulcerans TaxID=3115852 RepID=A0ABU7HQ62_9PSED|nr:MULTISPECIES: hypothetical protein [unclassified Pseudomonas]MEE1922651.1 hypothetical protein [Pseudomonas sp. 147P]MEE1933628.1 hypothetical protein [Pseudomonas sp. 148P]